MAPRDPPTGDHVADVQDARHHPSSCLSSSESRSVDSATVISPSSPLSPRARPSSHLHGDLKHDLGLPTTFGNRPMRDMANPSLGRRRSHSDGAFRLAMPSLTPSSLALSAFQFLSVPVIILDPLKTVVLANGAMGRLLGIHSELDELSGPDDMEFVLNHIRGQSLSQVGIDLMQDNGPVWIEWEQFLDQVATETRTGKTSDPARSVPVTDGDLTPTETIDAPRASPNDAVVDVVISKRDFGRSTFDSRVQSKGSGFQSYAKMLISSWEYSDKQTYFTLSFTHTELNRAPPSFGKTLGPRSESAPCTQRNSPSATSETLSQASSLDSRAPSRKISSTSVSLSSSPFPPMGPPSNSSLSSTPSILQKITTMKDALLDNTQTPVLAMWKDGSVTFPNRAARELFNRNADLDNAADGFELLQAWSLWTEDFSRQLDVSEYPMSILLRTETPFTGRRIGMYDADGNKLIFDTEGAAITDEHTAEFLAGVVTCRDVTQFTEEIRNIKAADAERFKLICDSMPQLVWTTRPDGYHDFFNSRWYTYTGLSEAESLGMGWKLPFHPDDMAETQDRWLNSLRTGEPYVTEYRCRRKDGEWRWFLGRALPLRNKNTGEIERWFGTCTDVHESIEAKLEARQTRQQLRSVIAHSRMTMFTVDLNRAVTMLEGALIWDYHRDNNSVSKWYIGENVYDVFNRLNSGLPEGQMPQFLKPLEAVLAGTATEDIQEHEMDGRWYRTRLQPILEKNRDGESASKRIEGVIGLIMDVTELKARERDLEEQEREKRQLVANEAAAKEASRLKSQFLANMSHEIRTPITGVMGLAELLLDNKLEGESRELAENIYRSGNALLTVINDILDFSKVESGHLDIEEVQFSLTIIIRDVRKMLSFAADKKHLDFQSDIATEIDRDLVLLGDPGRVRQIITNLLTNSIKFTDQGWVKFSATIEKEDPETIEVKFVVQDTGVGIEEDVRKHLFQPFSQGDSSTARKFGGTGLGLTICKNLLDLMNGRITLESAVGVGTTATFWIPFKRPQGVRRSSLVQIDSLPERLQSEMSVSCNSSEYEQFLNLPAGDQPFPSPDEKDKNSAPWRNPSIGSLSPAISTDDVLPMTERAKLHVLVVEDNAINQQIAMKTIKKLGFQVEAAWNGKDALEYLTAAKKGLKTRPDVILMDVQMPVIDGYKCTHLIRHHFPYNTYVSDVPIVAMTASAIRGDREKCKKAGMDDYLAKPVKSKLLERMLIRWLTSKRRSPLSSSGGSARSTCSSASSEQCNNSDIPVVGVHVDEDDAQLVTPMPLGSPNEELDGDGDDRAANMPTPRASHDHVGGYFASHTAMAPPLPSHLPLAPSSSNPSSSSEASGSRHHSVSVSVDGDGDIDSPQNRFHSAELAMHGRDDKLMDAAGGGRDYHTHDYDSFANIGSPSQFEDSAHEALTVENMGRLEEEQEGRRHREEDTSTRRTWE